MVYDVGYGATAICRLHDARRHMTNMILTGKTAAIKKSRTQF